MSFEVEVFTRTVENKHDADSMLYTGILTNEESEIIVWVINVYLSSVVCLFGIATNVINLVVFYKQGLDTSINITFFALAISDLCGLIMQQGFNILINPMLGRTNVLIVPAEFQFLTFGVPRAAFARITCLITIYITMERCISITFPLHVKQIITPCRTVATMLIFYFGTFWVFSLFYITASIGWKFYPESNRTLLGLVFTADNEKLTEILDVIMAFIGLASFAVVVILTAILIQKLGQKSSWRDAVATDQPQSKDLSSRDRKIANMVVLISSLLIICYIPDFICFIVTFSEPEFHLLRRYHNLITAMWSIGFLLETINSSVNILLYLKMSTKYRETFWSILKKPQQKNFRFTF